MLVSVEGLGQVARGLVRVPALRAARLTCSEGEGAVGAGPTIGTGEVLPGIR